MAIAFSREILKSCSETDTSLELAGKKCRRPFIGCAFCENIPSRSVLMQTSHVNMISRLHS